jgi:hypothetical protein
VAPTLVLAGVRRVGEVGADAEDGPAVEATAELAQLVHRESHRVPDTGLGRASQGRARDTGDPKLRPSHERGGEPAVNRQERALVAHAPRHLVERGSGQVEPLVEELPALAERRAERFELPFHPAGRDRRHHAAAREEIERRQLLQSDQWVPGRDDQRRNAELQALCPAGEEAERDERLRDRAVDGRVLVRHDQVVGHPGGVEARLLCGKRAGRQPLRLEAFAVVREDQAEVERHCGRR